MYIKRIYFSILETLCNEEKDKEDRKLLKSWLIGIKTIKNMDTT